jgi:ATP-dependent DNA helicase RecQ
MLLSCVKRTGERFGAAYVIQVLRGSHDRRVRSFGHDRLSTYAIGKDRSEEEWRHISRELVRRGYLRQAQEEFNALKVTERGRAVLFDGEKVVLAVPRKAPSLSVEATAHPHPALFDRLRALRKRLADERGLPPYVIFHDSTLKHMAARLPATTAELLRVPGVGERKAQDYGDAFLGEIAAYVEETGARPAPLPDTPPSKPRGGLSSTVRETVRLFCDGQDMLGIARIRGLTQTTIEGHLAEALEAGEDIDVDRLVRAEKRRAIEAAMTRLGSHYLGPIMEYLGDGYTYGELRLVRAALRAKPGESNRPSE